jgi:hypothetical protein
MDVEVGCEFTDFGAGSVPPHQVVNLVDVEPALDLPCGSKTGL